MTQVANGFWGFSVVWTVDCTDKGEKKNGEKLRIAIGLDKDSSAVTEKNNLIRQFSPICTVI